MDGREMLLILVALALAIMFLKNRSGSSIKLDTANEAWKTAQDLRLKESERLANAVVAQHPTIVEKFLSLGETKVSTFDEYGDENWKALSREAARCIEKLAEAEGSSCSAASRSSSGSFRVKEGAYGTVPNVYSSSLEAIELYENIRLVLERRFREYHAEESVRQRNPDEVARMTGVEFEAYLMRLLKKHGCSVRGTPRTGDKGADIVVTFGEKVIVIQAKRSASTVGIRAVQEIVTSVAHYNATEAWVVTNSTFTQQAREIAQRNGVRLVSGAELPRVGDFLQTIASA